jgi:hypothetical protein
MILVFRKVPEPVVKGIHELGNLGYQFLASSLDPIEIIARYLIIGLNLKQFLLGDGHERESLGL